MYQHDKASYACMCYTQAQMCGGIGTQTLKIHTCVIQLHPTSRQGTKGNRASHGWDSGMCSCPFWYPQPQGASHHRNTLCSFHQDR